jgi:hypothetical protein
VYAIARAVINLVIQAGYIEANDWLNLIFRVGLSVAVGGLVPNSSPIRFEIFLLFPLV